MTVGGVGGGINCGERRAKSKEEVEASQMVKSFQGLGMGGRRGRRAYCTVRCKDTEEQQRNSRTYRAQETTVEYRRVQESTENALVAVWQ